LSTPIGCCVIQAYFRDSLVSNVDKEKSIRARYEILSFRKRHEEQTDMENVEQDIQMATPPDPTEELTTQMSTLEVDSLPSSSSSQLENKPRNLELLPNELIFGILDHVDSARDVLAIMSTSSRFRAGVDDDGWKSFALARFDSLGVKNLDRGQLSWKQMTESLTWQSWCWDRRALRFAGMFPVEVKLPRGQQVRRAQPPRTILDARTDIDNRHELVVWGAGQNIVARYRGRAADNFQTNSSWKQISGEEFGFAASQADVQAITIVDLPYRDGSTVLAGRTNGDLSLYSVKQDDGFGTRLANFSPAHFEDHQQRLHAEDWQKKVESVDIHDEKRQGLMAVTTNTGPILLYRLPGSLDEGVTNVAPIDSFDLLATLITAGDRNQVSILNAKWMGENDLAVATRGSNLPLKYLTITPSGWTVDNAAKNPGIDVDFGPRDGAVYPDSLHPVQPHPDVPGTKLLLSAWRDGTVRQVQPPPCPLPIPGITPSNPTPPRLMDIRTPSPWDLIYQDNIQPSDPIGTILTYGTERFIGGSMDGAKVKIFDFRWSRSYSYTDALPCATYDPFPPAYQPFYNNTKRITAEPHRCSHVLGERCRWHRLSRDLYHRPNASLMLGKSIPDRLRNNLSITSLAKGSDLSPNFYAGISGGVIEGTLSPSQTGEVDPHLGFADWPRGVYQDTGYRTIDMGAILMEVGDGRSSRHNRANIRMPDLIEDQGRNSAVVRSTEEMLRKRYRLDLRWQREKDYEGF
jgi:hypothetical protein